METKWALLVSYGLTAQALKDFLPVEATLNATTIHYHALAVAQCCEDELGEEPSAFVEGCPANWKTLPIPDGPLTVGIDGGYVRDWDEQKGHFEVIVGKSILAFRRDNEEDIPSSKGFQEQYTSSRAGHDGAWSWHLLCLNCGAYVIVCPVEAIFNTADLLEWGRRPQAGIDTRGTGIGSAGVCLFPEQAAAGCLRMYAKKERIRAVGGR